MRTVSKETIRNWHRKRIQIIVNAGVNALAVETIPCLVRKYWLTNFNSKITNHNNLQLEAEAVAELLCEEFKNVKFWISFQCKVI